MRDGNGSEGVEIGRWGGALVGAALFGSALGSLFGGRDTRHVVV